MRKQRIFTPWSNVTDGRRRHHNCILYGRVSLLKISKHEDPPIIPGREKDEPRTQSGRIAE
jgi:hypothetical protein